LTAGNSERGTMKKEDCLEYIATYLDIDKNNPYYPNLKEIFGLAYGDQGLWDIEKLKYWANNFKRIFGSLRYK
jgi:hypothetical protein